MLSGAGLAWYEISNWALPGDECRHNLNYWQQGDYRGIGCAAHSHEEGRRWWNLRTPERYMKAVTSGDSPVAVSETLPPATRALEASSCRCARGRVCRPAALAAALEADRRFGDLVEIVAGAPRASRPRCAHLEGPAARQRSGLPAAGLRGGAGPADVHQNA